MADYDSGSDAAYIKPKFVPVDALLPRDNSGGIDFEPYTAEFGDGGRVTGAKGYLSAKGGSNDRGERRPRRGMMSESERD